MEQWPEKELKVHVMKSDFGTSTEKIIQVEGPEDMPQEICIRSLCDAFGQEEELTEARLTALLQQIRGGKSLGIYLSNNLEEGYFQLELNRGWICMQLVQELGTSRECFYSSFDPAYLDSDEESPMECSDGQSIILMRYIMHDLELAARCVEYYARTGWLYPGTRWLKGGKGS